MKKILEAVPISHPRGKRNELTERLAQGAGHPDSEGQGDRRAVEHSALEATDAPGGEIGRSA